jgi:hypothetical protein
MGRRLKTATIALLVAIAATLQTGVTQCSRARADKLLVLEIKLRSLGYQKPAEENFSDTAIARNPSLLLRETHSRVTFINDDMLVVYFSRAINAGKDTTRFPQVLEAFFVDTRSGRLISHKDWPTRYRRWFNDSFDTEGRIMPLQNGFLVHSGDSLRLYSSDFQLKRELLLDDGPKWSVRIAPLGRAIQALQISDSGGEAEWLDFETLDTVGENHQFPGVQSISGERAVVSILPPCLDLQRDGDLVRHLICGGAFSNEMPIFLADNDILVLGRGFEVFSKKGEVLWKRHADAKLRNESVGVALRSLNGNRFAFWLTGWSRSSMFDGTRIRKGYRTILVYDSFKRIKVFEASVRDSSAGFDFALSPNGDSLAVLAGESLYIYALPK